MKYSFIALLLVTFLFSCKKDPTPSNGNNYLGYMYTSTNSSTGNAIAALGRKSDGTLEELKESPYKTGAAGDAAEGDFDTEWALRIVGDYLLAVNAGANPVGSSISVFKINKANGHLTQVDQNPSTPAINNMESHGVRSVSITSKVINGTNWVVVGNQYANPNYQKDPPQAFGFPIVSTNLRNLAVFTFDESTGLLQFKKIGATYEDGTHGGPCTVDFNSDGTRLAVSTWGVTHFDADDADLKLQKPGRLYIYNFNGGNLTQTGMYEETGVSGNIGLSWSPNNKYIYLANFNLHSSKEANSLTVHDGATAAKIQNFKTGNRNDEACWTWVSLDKHKLFVASFTENVVSTFDIGGNDQLSVSLNPNFFVRRNVPPQDTKDMYETADGFLYVLGAFKSHSITVFKRASNGALSEIHASPYAIPSSIGKTHDEQAFLGLTGFEKNDLKY